MKIRTGIGYDVHAFAKDRKLILGGVEIPHTHGLAGHSDADVLSHAVSDALLGALSLGDIGKHFPDTDMKYFGANSLLLLKEVCRLVAEKGFEIGNVDAVVCAESPKLRPFIDDIRNSLAECMGLDPEDVSVKATTTEGLGFVGRKEGIAVMATCLLVKEGESDRGSYCGKEGKRVQ